MHAAKCANFIRLVLKSLKGLLLQLLLKVLSALEICPIFLLYASPLLTVGLFLLLIHQEVLLIKLVRVDVKVRIVLVLVILLILIASILLDILLIIGGAPLLSMVFFGGSLGLGVVLKDFWALSIRCNLRKLLGLGLALRLLWS